MRWLDHSRLLIADGYHARVDGWTSLDVLVGAVGVWLGYPLADARRWPAHHRRHPVARLAVGCPGGDAGVGCGGFGDRCRALACRRARPRGAGGDRGAGPVCRPSPPGKYDYCGQTSVSAAEGHAIAKEVRHQLLHHVRYFSGVIVHVDPADEAGEYYYRIPTHAHAGLAAHAH